MTIARNPLHGSGRAALPHPALASGDDAKSPQGIGMTYARRGQPPLDEPAHPLPGDVPCVTAPRERAVPEPAHLEPKHGDRRAVHGHPVVTSVPTHNLTQPCAHHGDRLVQPSLQLGFHLTELRLHPLPDRLPHHREPSTPLLPAGVREAEEVERLRLPLAGALSVLGREGPEFQQPRLLGVQLQAELCEPLTQVSQKPLGLRPVLEPHDEVVRAPHDFSVGFQHRAEAERFLADLRERFTKFGLELHPEKTRRLEFGPFAAENRQRAGQGKPETFDFLGFTHICGKKRSGRFTVVRQTIRKRVQAKLSEVKAELQRRLHEPIPVVGAWLRQIVSGHTRYYGVPMNSSAIAMFRFQVGWLWHRALARRSHTGYVSWERMRRLIERWLPPARVCHPYPLRRLGVVT